MTTQPITFPGARGELAGRIETPLGGHAHGWALFAHCFTCTKNLTAIVEISRALARQGIGVLRFDFAGLGESEGDFAETDFSSNVEDLVAAGRWMDEELYGPSLLVGHSLGGAAVLHAAHELPSVKAVATIGAPADPDHVLRHVSASREEIEETGEATVDFGGEPFTIRKEFLEDLEATRMEAAVEGLGRPLLILHSPSDETVEVENASRLWKMARHPRSIVALDGMDHLLSDRSDARYVAGVIASWAARYVGLPEPEEIPAEMATDEWVVARTGPEGFRTDVMARHHPLVADEPVAVGGTDEGATPYELLLAGLGSCTSITLRMYADRKGWPLDEVRVRLQHDRIHEEDTEADCEGGDARLDRMERRVHLVGDLDEEQRRRLVEIAEKCPVHRTLERGVEVETVEGS